MSNTFALQLGLAATGGVVLVGLMLHNYWTARKAQPRQADPVALVPTPAPTPEAAHPETSADVLAPDAAHTAATPFRPADIAVQGLSSASAAERKPLDPLLDALAPIELDAGSRVSGEAALAALPASRRVGDKPFAVEGLNAETGQWEPPQAGQLYSEFQAGVQLANRAGALNDIGFSEFTLKAQAFADAINGTPHFPDMIEEVARARELDQFATANDAKLSYVLRARGVAWSAGYVQQVAARHGFVAGALPGRLVLPSIAKGVPPFLSLEFDTQAALADDIGQSAIHEVLLCLDVPQVPPALQPFQRLCAVAQTLAKEMDGTIIDGNGYRIDSVAMESIGNDVEDLYLLLAQRDFHAGSILARRLFS